MRWLALLACIFVSAGCATYEYDIVRPAEFAGHVGSKTDRVVTLDPIEYRFLAVDNHLVVRIFNTSGEPIQLLGQQSSLIDPQGQARGVPSQTIYPAAFLKFILPPMPPNVTPTGPSVTFGLGVGIGRRDDDPPPIVLPADSPRPDQPPIYIDVITDPAYVWDWPDKTEVRLYLAYQQGQKTFNHEFIFRSQKM